jgi:hypothetical protein
MKRFGRTRAFFLVQAALLVSVLAGCTAASQTKDSFEQILPSTHQPDRIEMVTQEGFDILYSKKGNTEVATSLREATGDHLKFFISALNKGAKQRPVSPGRIQLKVRGSKAPQISMYSPPNVYDRLSRQASDDALTAARLTNATGRLYNTGEVTAEQAGQAAYGGGTSENSEKEVLLKSVQLGEGQRAAGFVYAPSLDTSAGQFTFKVPVGDEMHRFRYTFK